jgi:hypothetical protein
MPFWQQNDFRDGWLCLCKNDNPGETTMPTLTRSALVDAIQNRRGAFPLTIVAETEPAMRKTDNPYVGTTKIARVNGFCGADYENGVLRRRSAEGVHEPWEALPRKWGQRVARDNGSLTGLVRHVNKDGIERWYVELFVGKSLQHEYRFNGAVLDGNLLHPFMPQRREGERQGLEKPVIVRDYAVDNIQQVTMDGTTYDIGDE